jgi:hypothetical protein
MSKAHYKKRPAAQLGDGPCHRIRELPSVGGLGRNLGALSTYLDTLETAASFGCRSGRRFSGKNDASRNVQNPGLTIDFDQIIRNWMPLTHA